MSTPPLQISTGTTNLLRNPSAESDLAGIPSLGATASRITSESVHGEYGVQVVTSNVGKDEGVYFTSDVGLNIAGGSPYIGTVFAKGDAAIWLALRVYYLDGTNTLGPVSSMTLTSEWARYSSPVLPTNSAKTINFIQVHARTTTQQAAVFLLDAAQIEKGITPTPFTVGTRPERRLSGSHAISDTTIGPLRVGKD